MTALRSPAASVACAMRIPSRETMASGWVLCHPGGAIARELFPQRLVHFRQRLFIGGARRVAQVAHGLLSLVVSAPGRRLGPARQRPRRQPTPEVVGVFP